MSQTKVVHLVWNAGKDAYAGNRLVQELGPMLAVQEMSKTLVKTHPEMNEFDAVNISSNVLQYQTMLAQGFMPCHATRQRIISTKTCITEQQVPSSHEEILCNEGSSVE